MSNPILKYTKQYRVLCEIDKSTNDFPVDISPTGAEKYCDNDVYIKCAKDGRISYISRNRFEYYCPSKIRLKNLVEKINNVDPEIVIGVHYTDVDGRFLFAPANLPILEPILEISTYGAGRSPFSAKNLPKSNFNLPAEVENKYKDIVNYYKDDENKIAWMQTIRKVNTEMLSKIPNHTKEMRSQGLKTKEYIYTKGLWEDYLEMLKQAFA